MSKKISTDPNLTDDLIWGVGGKNGIAAFLKIPTARAYYLIARGVLPVKKLSHRTIAASRHELREFFRSDASHNTTAT
jgi:hypothetical protein